MEKHVCCAPWCKTCPFHHFPPSPKLRDYLKWKQWDDTLSQKEISE